jgi:arginase
VSGGPHLDPAIGGPVIWARDLDLVVPMWQGADDHRLTGGPAALTRLVERGRVQRVIDIPTGAGAHEGGVRHLEILTAAHRDVRRGLMENAPERVLVLGSDCAIEAVTISYLMERHGGVAVAWFDAHADLNTPQSSPSGAAHGMALRLLMGEGHADLLPPSSGWLDPSSVVLAGVRAMDPAEAEFIASRDIAHARVEALDRDPTLVSRALPPGRPVYVHLDVDVLDPNTFPATGWPAPNGLVMPTLEAVMEDLFSHRDVIGIGVVEFVPSIRHDPDALKRMLAALRLR